MGLLFVLSGRIGTWQWTMDNENLGRVLLRNGIVSDALTSGSGDLLPDDEKDFD
ncbi:MAG: hypothetical protein FWF88_13755 [Peptococcaceae bacterium]|nr:hypothetical protein [Peptococcaceae bacterium]